MPLSRGRSAWLGLLAVVAVTVIVVVDLRRSGSAEGAGEHLVAVGVLVSIVLLAAAGLLLLGPRLPQYRIDPTGIVLWSLQGEAAVPWDQVESVRVTHTRAGTWPLDFRTGRHLEIQLVPGVTREDHPRAGAWWSDGVTGAALSMTYPGRAPGVGPAVRAVAPGRWGGEHERPKIKLEHLER